MADERALRQQELARLMLQKAQQDLEAVKSLSFDRQAGAKLAEDFVAWAHRLVEAPVESGEAEK